MNVPKDETLVTCVDSVRKGRMMRGELVQNSCEIGVTILRKDGIAYIVLRTEDVSGVQPIVAVLDDNSSKILEHGLAHARAIIEQENI